jgi:hypothetical protein
VAVHAIRGPSWILVRRGSSTGPVVYEGVVPAGTTMRFTGHALFMRLGAVANVDVHLGRELVDIRCSAAGGVLLTEGVAVAAGPTSCPVPGS